MRLYWMLVCAIAIGSSAPAAAAPVRSDRSIAEEVADRVRAYAFYTIFDEVDGSVENGLVTLTGMVTAPHKAKDLGRIVAAIRGVREVHNKLRSASVSPFDDELRWRIAERIYGDEMFWKYRIQTHPTIHVIVDRGHVTLTGVVDSEVERRRAEILARDVFGSFSVRNKLRVD